MIELLGSLLADVGAFLVGLAAAFAFFKRPAFCNVVLCPSKKNLSVGHSIV